MSISVNLKKKYELNDDDDTAKDFEFFYWFSKKSVDDIEKLFRM